MSPACSGSPHPDPYSSEIEQALLLLESALSFSYKDRSFSWGFIMAHGYSWGYTGGEVP